MKNTLVPFLLVTLTATCVAQQFPTGRPDNRPNAQGVSKTWSKISWSELRSQLKLGGFVIVFRHGATDWSKKDQLPIQDWNDRSKQRLLSDLGRQQSRDIGEVFRQLRIPVGTVLSSPYFRAREFAQIAFGKYQQTLSLLDGRREDFEKLFNQVPTKGTNTIFSAHQLPLVNLGYFKMNELEEGSCGVFKPDGKGHVEHVAHMNVKDWKSLTILK
jgi:hypothetical protein